MKTTNPKVVAELKRLLKKDKGFLKPETVVESARSKQSILHKYFVWDDTEAAHLYRLSQASVLIRTTVHFLEINGERRSVRAFVSLAPDRDKGSGYREMVSVLSNPGLREQMLRDALDELAMFELRYQHLRELADVFAASKKARKELTQLF
jgi:hypothetical protein